MTKQTLNPYVYINNFTSHIRNIILIASLGITTIGFSTVFDKFSEIIKIIAVIFLIFSIIYGFKATSDFNTYIRFIQKEKISQTEPLSFQIKQWKDWIHLTYYFLVLIIFLIIIVFSRKL